MIHNIWHALKLTDGQLHLQYKTTKTTEKKKELKPLVTDLLKS